MKTFEKIVIGSTVAFAISACLFVGIENKAKQVEATEGLYSGSVFIQKNDNDMKYTGSKLVAYFFDSDSHKGWNEPVWNTGNTYQEVSWSLNFEPTTAIILRVDGTNWSSASPWSNVWSRTGNVPLSGTDVIWMYGSAAEDNTAWGYYSMETLVMSDGGTQLAELSDKKIASGGESLETFGEVSLAANQKFYIKKTIDEDKKYATYSCHELIVDNLSLVDENAYIQVTEAAKYEFYFNFNGNTLYLTDPIIASADEWSQGFLGITSASDNCTYSMSNWSAYAETYAALDTEAKNYFVNQDYIGPNDSYETYYEAAVQRYDHVLKVYGVYDKDTNTTGYSDFMGRTGVGGKLSLSKGVYDSNTVTSNAVVYVTAIAATVSLAGIGGYFLLRKKRQAE